MPTLRCEAGETLVVFLYFFADVLFCHPTRPARSANTGKIVPSVCCDFEVSPEQDGRTSGADDAIAGVQGVQSYTLCRDLVDLKAQRGDSFVHQGELQPTAAEVGN